MSEVPPQHCIHQPTFFTWKFLHLCLVLPALFFRYFGNVILILSTISEVPPQPLPSSLLFPPGTFSCQDLVGCVDQVLDPSTMSEVPPQRHVSRSTSQLSWSWFSSGKSNSVDRRRKPAPNWINVDVGGREEGLRHSAPSPSWTPPAAFAAAGVSAVPVCRHGTAPERVQQRAVQCFFVAWWKLGLPHQVINFISPSY